MNNNPYKVLGVSPDADDETIKKAYRELARKYHPDRYADSDLADIASEKMKEVNAAYEEIQRLRATGESFGQRSYDSRQARHEQAHYENPSTASHADYSQYSDHARATFIQVRNLINSGNIAEAERLLSEIDEADRGAEWFFLTGCIQLHKGFYVDAQRSFDTAYRMEPSNNEYWTFKERMHDRAGRFGGGYNTGSGRNTCSGCDICSGLICADCCCECMGGDLIPCC